MFNREKPEVAAAQKVMLEILCEIHKICVENNIRYWLVGGTLIGAVRHKGFIPWDDDCDVGMLREDFNKFLEVAPGCLSAGLHLQTRDVEPEYHLPFAKIRKDGTLLVESGETGNENYHHGIFVDVFPYDRYSSATFLNWMHWGKHFRDRRNRYKRHSWKRVLVTFYTNVIMGIPVVFTRMIGKWFVGHPERYGDKNSKYISFGMECRVNCVNLVEDYLPVRLSEKCFEGYDFYVPANSDAVLSAEYGKDYMQLPPIEKRTTHAKIIKV